MTETFETKVIRRRKLNHGEAATAVLKKLTYVYKLTNEELHFSTTDHDRVTREIVGFLIGPQWVKTCRAALTASGLSDNCIGDIKRLSAENMNQVCTALHIRNSVYEKPEAEMREAQRNFYSYRAYREKMVDAYINHLNNELFDKLRDSGLNEKSARCVMGVSICGAFAAYTKLKTSLKDLEIRPTVQHTTGKSDEALTEELSIVQTYWRRLRDDMLTVHRVNYPQPSR